MDLLLMTLRSQQSDEEKMEHAQRWESALEDAVSIENNEYLSDNEDAFFAK